jgi:hypothetical protein
MTRDTLGADWSTHLGQVVMKLMVNWYIVIQRSTRHTPKARRIHLIDHIYVGSSRKQDIAYKVPCE